MLRNTLFGREVYVVGGQQGSCPCSRNKCDQSKDFLHGFRGICAAFAVMIMVARFSPGQPNASAGFEFNVIAGILLGGVTLSGGEGNLLGTLIGVIFLEFCLTASYCLGFHHFGSSLSQDLLS